ncbi:exosome complex component RRP42-like [Homalodisca vitripennis]|uniref:Ribosomal RNA-processing protein 42 n=1 Tax=Homalodisca liturata TaxID=320908 RepID=A0A1B6ID95_9HEMI|nr:exosome complex component RRP42-like [Homalodisca vitripennis]
MANVLLSEAEKTFILQGVEDNFRCDGRSCRDYRPMELETDVVSNASGSARLRLANTDILVGVKTEIDVPFPETPNQGKLEFFVDCSANATPEFEGRGGEELATEISNSLARAYALFPLEKLCILQGLQCWKLYADILVLECGGNLFDAVSLAVKAALHNTRVPRVTGAEMDGGQVDLTLSDDPFDCWRLDVSTAPLIVTLCKIGDHCVVDPTAEEETCSTASIVIATTPDSKVTYVFKTGFGSFHSHTLKDTLKVGKEIGITLNQELAKALSKEEKLGEKRERYGFLK